MLGERISNFEVVQLLGDGGMGAVYEAKHPLIGKRVAIKLLKPERSVDPGLVQRFLNEARATSAIRHPNIVEVMDLGTLPSGAPYLVMELLEGETLGDRLERVGRLALPVALDFVRQTASALEAAHARGIVHRDLKPDNLFLVTDPRLPGRELVKVLDFGIAKLRGDLSTGPVDTLAGAVLGTPSYMSPEQCRGVPEQLDHRTDIYALGVILYEMVCGAPPFVADGLGDTMMMHMSVPPPPPSSLGEELPGEVEQAILRALAKRPEDRFASMAELRAALEPPPTSVVVFPAAVPIDAERYVVQAVSAGARGGGMVRWSDEPQRSERARPVSGTATRPAGAQLARARAAELAADGDEAASSELAQLADARTLRDDEDTLADAPRPSWRPHAVAAAALLCGLLAGAAWLLPRMTASRTAAPAQLPSANAAARLAAAPQPAPAAPELPMTAVLPAAPTTLPVPLPAAERTARSARSTGADAARSERRLKRKSASAGDPAAPGTDTASGFAAAAAGEAWEAEPLEAVGSGSRAGSDSVASPATGASEPLAVDTLARLQEPAVPPQLVAAAPQAKAVPEALPAPQRLATGAKSASPPAADARLAIVGLQVRGSLPESVVRHGIERVRADFERCYRRAAPGASGRLGRVAVSFELDELGRVQNARANGSSLAPLDRCIAGAMRNASSRRAPDTGIVRGSFQLEPGR